MGWNNHNNDDYRSVDTIKICFYTYLYACGGMLLYKNALPLHGLSMIVSGLMYHTALIVIMFLIIAINSARD